jgi:hypothetical protein
LQFSACVGQQVRSGVGLRTRVRVIGIFMKLLRLSAYARHYDTGSVAVGLRFPPSGDAHQLTAIGFGYRVTGSHSSELSCERLCTALVHESEFPQNGSRPATISVCSRECPRTRYSRPQKRRALDRVVRTAAALAAARRCRCSAEITSAWLVRSHTSWVCGRNMLFPPPSN